MSKGKQFLLEKPEIWAAGIIIIFIGAMLAIHNFLQDYQQEYVEDQAAAQLKVAAQLEGERFRQELDTLEKQAAYLQQEGGASNDFFNSFLEHQEAAIGVLDFRGQAVYGDRLPPGAFEQIRPSFHGHSIVSYSDYYGLLFSVPVYHGRNIRYVLYKRLDSAMLGHSFSLTAFDGSARLLVTDREQNVIIPYVGYSQTEALYLASPELSASWLELNRRLKFTTAAAVFHAGDGQSSLLCRAEIPGTTFLLCGYVPASAVIGSIPQLTRSILIIFVLLLAFLLACLIYALHAEKKNLQNERLQQEKERAEAANRAKSSFLANMSHEIRTPINAVIGMNELILRESTEPQIHSYAENIDRAGHNLLELINDILDFSKIEAGRMERLDRHYHLSHFLADLRSLLEPRLTAKGLKFRFEVDPAAPELLYGDDTHLRQIMLNLLSNAMKYTSRGSVTCLVSCQAQGSKASLQLAVADTGCGIAPESRDLLFQRFARLEEKKHRSILGTGLGLAITRRLVTLLEGTIGVESTYGAGSTFTVCVPQTIASEEQIGDFEQRYREIHLTAVQHQALFSAPQAHVLVVDDNEMNLLVVKGLLKRTRINVTTCLSGAACLQLLQQEEFDIVFLDHMMPDMDGIETLQRAKALPNNASAQAVYVMMTANAISGAKEKYLEAGFDAYISKPIDSNGLEQLLAHRLPLEKILPPVAPTPQPGLPPEPVLAAKPDSAATADTGPAWQELLNEATGLRYSAGSEEMYREFLQIFLQLHQEKSSQIKDLFTEKNWTNYTVSVHALKGNALNIGAEKLSAAAKELELAGKAYQKDGDAAALELIRTKTDALLDLFAQTAVAVQQYLKEAG